MAKSIIGGGSVKKAGGRLGWNSRLRLICARHPWRASNRAADPLRDPASRISRRRHADYSIPIVTTSNGGAPHGRPVARPTHGATTQASPKAYLTNQTDSRPNPDLTQPDTTKPTQHRPREIPGITHTTNQCLLANSECARADICLRRIACCGLANPSHLRESSLCMPVLRGLAHMLPTTRVREGRHANRMDQRGGDRNYEKDD